MTHPNEPGKPDNNDKPQPAIPNQYSFLWLSAAFFLMFLWLQDTGRPQQQELAYSEFKGAVLNGQVQEVTLRNEEIRGRFTEAGAARFSSDTGRSTENFLTLRPPVDDPDLLSLLERQEVVIRGAPSGRPWWQDLILGFLPWILLLALMFWFWGAAQKRMTQGGGPFDYAKSRARRARKETSSTTWTTWQA